jgi:hypothetical protein
VDDSDHNNARPSAVVVEGAGGLDMPCWRLGRRGWGWCGRGRVVGCVGVGGRSCCCSSLAGGWLVGEKVLERVLECPKWRRKKK